MLEVSGGTVWWLKYMGSIFGHGTNDIWEFHSQIYAWGRGSEEKHTLSHGPVSQGVKLVHQEREEVETMWDTWPCLMCHITAGV